ncbi:MAG TPA: hypothetical protein VJP02_11560 [Candidatus Sulfotelmatobacter sp.]|nr:hypothetical protein [Candidatus Sulfotelmatobacter sp.]
MHGELERTALDLVEASRKTTSDTSAGARALRDDLLIQPIRAREPEFFFSPPLSRLGFESGANRLDPWRRQA